MKYILHVPSRPMPCNPACRPALFQRLTLCHECHGSDDVCAFMSKCPLCMVQVSMLKAPYPPSLPALASQIVMISAATSMREAPTIGSNCYLRSSLSGSDQWSIRSTCMPRGRSYSVRAYLSDFVTCGWMDKMFMDISSS